jgi:hypothetical protein
MIDEELRLAYAELLQSRIGGDRARCPAPPDLATAAARSGSEARRLELLDHIMGCPHCQREFELLRSLTTAKPVTPRLATAAWLVAALLVLSVGVGIIWRNRAAIPPGEVVRGGEDVQLIMPAPDAEGTAPLALAWRPVEGAAGYVLTLADDAGQVRTRLETPDTTLILDAGAAPGLFRWWVTARLQDGTTLDSRPRLLRITP